MLRVGLTGGLGSGKSTVAEMLRKLGAYVVESDELGRELMKPGQTAFNQIVRAFGSEVLLPDGNLDRPRLAELAFKGGRVKDLNAIIHPAVIEAQRQWMDELFAREPAAVAVVVSALIFEVERDARAGGKATAAYADLRKRIDRIILVTAPENEKIARYVSRLGLSGINPEKAESDARSRLAHQIPDAEKAARAAYIIENSGDMTALRAQVEALWPRLKAESNSNPTNESLK
jgi:dephospho-CoA kinase